MCPFHILQPLYIEEVNINQNVLRKTISQPKALIIIFHGHKKWQVHCTNFMLAMTKRSMVKCNSSYSKNGTEKLFEYKNFIGFLFCLNITTTEILFYDVLFSPQKWAEGAKGVSIDFYILEESTYDKIQPNPQKIATKGSQQILVRFNTLFNIL